jgi:rubrerythrin
LVALGLTAILGFFWLRRRSPATRPAANVMSRKARRGKRPAGVTTAAVFCTQCGHPLRLEDNFCPKCGTKRRVQG